MSGPAGDGSARERLGRVLAEQVYDGEAYKPFAEMTVAEVETRAGELRGAAGFGSDPAGRGGCGRRGRASPR